MYKAGLMLIKIKYRSRIRDSVIKEQSRSSDVEFIAHLSDPDVNLTRFFQSCFEGLGIKDRGVSFEFDESDNQLYCSAYIELDKKPSNEQLDCLVYEVTEQLDCGYYGEDGWFVDVGPNSYYIDLVDHGHTGKQPVSVKIVDRNT